MTNRIRVVAVAVCRVADRVLVERGYDDVEDLHFYRAIGGGVAFGERAEAAVAREWREEYGIGLAGIALLGVLENIFTFEGVVGHEVAFVFAAHLPDSRAQERGEFESTDTDGSLHAAVWVPIDELRAGPAPLYPAGVLDFVAGASR